MPNSNKNKKNQPPTGEGKKQSPRSGADRKLGKRSEVVQAQRGRTEENLGTEADETAARGESLERPSNPKRTKSGR